ncbi:MAG: hypothetical protein AAF620_00490 [Bacteroidota bacterium]
MSNRSKKIIIGILIIAVLLSVWNYYIGYYNAISWKVTTTAEVITFPAWEMDNGLIKHQINGEKYLLQERYSGSEIKRNISIDQMYLATIWFGICTFLALSTTFNRNFFFVVIAALALMINRLNLHEIELFGVEKKIVMIIFFISLAGPLVYFHEFNKKIPFAIRLGVLILVSMGMCFGINDATVFTDHFLAHSLFSFILFSVVFLALLSEEIVFTLLYVVSSSKGGKSNHLHFIILSSIYLGNLMLYYLNKSGIYENSFFFFDPFLLLVLSTSIALWSLKFKDQLLKEYLPQGLLPLIFASLGMITFSFLSLSYQRGIDSIYQSFYYLIVYFHIGFGTFFLFYIIANFLDPLIKGFEVYKIAYRERNFPYVTARIGGFIAIAAFYFLSGQEPYNLLRSGYYNYLSEKEEAIGNELLSKEYLSYAEFLGFNTHYPNYRLGWKEWIKENEFNAKSYFFNATQRYPSPFAWINYGNLESEVNPNKVQATYDEALRRINSPEMKNNLGIIHLQKGEVEHAINYFDNIEFSDSWNHAPLINKWNALKKIESYDSLSAWEDYQKGNFGVKSNILTTLVETRGFEFVYNDLGTAALLHRHAYLLNSSFIFKHDSIKSFIQKELDQSTNTTTINRLAKALALHLYKRGEVNQAFIILDQLQANSNRLLKGTYLDALGKLALDQSAYLLAIDFFTEAIQEGHESSRLNRLEAFAALGEKEKVTNELLKIIEKDPSLTDYGNDLIQKASIYDARIKKSPALKIDSMSTSDLILLAQKNAFNDEIIISAVNELNKRDTLSGYNILIEAIEINPYSSELLKSYILTAIRWNLNEYAEQSLEKLREITSDKDFNSFLELYYQRKKELRNDGWI